jgi:RecB family exonuclease
VIEVVPTRYGAAAQQALAETVAAAQGGDPLAPVTIVVPSNYAGVAARRALAAHGRGVANLTVVTAYRLAELLAGAVLARQGRRPVTAPVVAAAIRRALQDVPGMFADAAAQPGTVEAMERAHRDLRELVDPQLRAVARASPRAHDLVAIHRRARQVLVDGGWFDERDLLDSAVEQVAETGPALAQRFGTVVVHLPQELSVGAGTLLRAVSRHVPTVVVCGLTGVSAGDAAAARVLHERLGVRSAPALPAPNLFDARADVVVIDTTDPDDEVRAAVRRLIDAAAGGTPFERMAVVYPNARPYARLVADHLDAADVPWNGAATVSLLERIAGRALLGLLDLRDRELSRHELFGLLSSVPAIGPAGGPLPVSRWEQRSRDAGVVAGVDQWRQRLARLADRYRMPRADSDGDAQDAGPDPRLGDVESLGRFVQLLHRQLTPPRHPTWRALSRWAGGLIDFLVGGEAVRERWPRDEARAAERIFAALDRLSHLDDIEPHPTVTAFRHALTAELDASLTTIGRLGRGVFVAPIGLAVGVQADVVVVVGAAEGSLPPLLREDPLLRDSDRRAAGVLATTETQRERAHHQALAVGAAATTQLVVTRPRGDLRSSRGLHPSRWIPEILCDRTPSVQHVGSFREGVHAATCAATEQDALLVALDDGGRLHEDHQLVGQDVTLARAVRLRRARASDAFTEFDGNLGAIAPLPSLDGERPLSPSRIEQWMRCPFAYFVRYLLRVDTVEAPEDLLELPPRERGTLVHGALEALLRRAIDDGEVPDPDATWSAAQIEGLHVTLAALAAEAEANGLTGLPLFWARQQRKMRRWMGTFLADDADLRRRHGARPVAVEVCFGIGGAAPVEVTLPGGRRLRLAGRIDRIDQAAGTIVVTDYKTSKKDRLGANEKHPLGRTADRLQLPIYGLAARQFLGRPDDEVHVCYLSVSDQPGVAQVPLNAETLAQLDRVVGVAAAGIEGGIFPCHPEGGTGWMHFISCWYCDPDGLGTSSARSRWERKRACPELEDYVALTEPGAVAQ